MKKYVIALVFILAFEPYMHAQTKADEKLQAVGDVIQDIQQIEETIPKEILKNANGLVLVPNLLNAGFVVGGKRGKGIALIKHQDGSWSNPVFISLTGGSIGFQAGIQKIDLILVFKKSSTLTQLGKSDFTLGGDVSVSAGPIGRNSSAKTNDALTAEVYSYSRSRGLFAGISIDGAVIKVTRNLNRDFYGKAPDNTEALQNKDIKKDASLQRIHSLLNDMQDESPTGPMSDKSKSSH